MRILHLADVHLDRPFVGLPASAAAAQRRNLFDAFSCALSIGKERHVALVTIGGDLWEEEHVRADTRASVAHELGQLDVPVLIVCGNHDPLVPGGSYSRTAWPANVQVVPLRSLREFRYGDVSIWSVSWGGGDLSPRVLEHFDAPGDGRRHVALLHGTAPTAPFAEEAGGYFPFNPRRLREAGISVCLAGHIHAASFVDGVVYPGSPEPLGWAERGRHCVAIVEVGEEVDVELVDVNKTRFETVEVDCSGCESSAEVDDRIDRALAQGDGNLFLRVRLVGVVGPDCDVDTLHVGGSRRTSFALLQIEDATETSLDIEGRLERKSLDGLFTRKLLEEIESAPDERARRIARLALEAGLRAVEGREPVLHVG
jgi:DNA repair protein SbcD/Mre11